MPKLTLSFKGRPIDVYHLQAGETLIGRDGSCEIAIDSLAIAPMQVSIIQDDEGCHLEALEKEFPVLVNQNQTDSVDLQHGDVIQVGKHTLTFAEDFLELGGDLLQEPVAQTPEETLPEEEEEPAHKGMLQIMSGDNFGRIIPLHRNMTRIGRVGGDCAMIARRESGYYLSHLEGPNPPVLNKRPIGEGSQLLNDGDIIDVGATRMQFHT